MDNNDWSSQFQSFFKSPLGVELLRSLREDLHDNIVKDAQTSKTMDEAYGLIKEAGGVIKSIEHMMFLSAVLSEDSRKN